MLKESGKVIIQVIMSMILVAVGSGTCTGRFGEVTPRARHRDRRGPSVNLS